MAHYQQQKFVEIISEKYPEFFKDKKILEVGSWIANDTIRQYFVNCEYVGADVAQGPGVDIVCSGELLDFASESFDVSASCECFEHNPHWISTFVNMHRMVKPGGLIMVSCATIGRGEHGTTRKSPDASLTVISGKDDYYANLAKSDFNRFDLNLMFDDYKIFYNTYFCDLYFIGFKKSNTNKNKISLDVANKIRAIRELNEPKLKRVIEKRINFWITFLYAKLIGEKNYHHFKFYLRTTLMKKKLKTNNK